VNETINGQLRKRRRWMSCAMIAGGITAAAAAHANSFDKIVVVPPADLPTLARQSGEAMLLHETRDGRMLLYIEQEQGRRVAVLDVTDPAHTKGDGSAQLDAAGPFDFVAPAGAQAELVRYRQGQGDAILDLRQGTRPMLKSVQGLNSKDATTQLGEDGHIVGSAAEIPAEVQPPQDIQVVEAATSKQPVRIFDVKQVSEEISNASTGTTFLLAQDGLYLLRRPAVESIREMEMIPPN
jgi:hypothetical protein